MSNKFTARPFDKYDKWIEIDGPDGLYIKVDFDDVNQEVTRIAVRRMLSILNNRWETPSEESETT